jgi:uncharacterized protein (DUF433 family)
MAAVGLTINEVVAALPGMEPEDVSEALHYAAAALQERTTSFLDAD